MVAVTENVTSDVTTGDVRHVVWCIVVAGGSGSRFGRPKQYEAVGGERILDRSVSVAATVCAGVIVVVPAADVATESARFAHVVAGGSSRSESVRTGLAAVPDAATVICVHDAARPFATPELYRRVVDAIDAGADGAIPGIVVTDTIKVIAPDGAVIGTPTATRCVPFRRRRRSVPTCCGVHTPPVARAPTTPHWWRRAVGGWWWSMARSTTARSLIRKTSTGRARRCSR